MESLFKMHYRDLSVEDRYVLNPRKGSGGRTISGQGLEGREQERVPSMHVSSRPKLIVLLSFCRLPWDSARGTEQNGVQCIHHKPAVVIGLYFTQRLHLLRCKSVYCVGIHWGHSHFLSMGVANVSSSIKFCRFSFPKRTSYSRNGCRQSCLLSFLLVLQS